MQPQNLFNVFNDLFVQPFVSVPDETNGVYGLTMTEDSADAKLRQVSIRNVPKNSLLLNTQNYSKLNLGNALKTVFKSKIGLFKCCDYVILTVARKQLYAIFIEMKSNSVNPAEVITQFKGAGCFVEYCGAIARYFHDAPAANLLSLQTRYVLFASKAFNKTTTKIRNYQKHSSPDNYARPPLGVGKGNASYIMFDKLL